MISETNLSEHSRICVINSDYFKKTSNGYQCKRCFAVKESKPLIFQHIYEECWQNISITPTNKENVGKLQKNIEELKKCDICKEMISETNLSEHIRICSINSDFFKETSNGYQCKRCFVERESRQSIYQHIYQECWQNLSTVPIINEKSNQPQKNVEPEPSTPEEDLNR